MAANSQATTKFGQSIRKLVGSVADRVADDTRRDDAYPNLQNLILSMPAWAVAEELHSGFLEQTRHIKDYDAKLDSLTRRINAIIHPNFNLSKLPPNDSIKTCNSRTLNDSQRITSATTSTTLVQSDDDQPTIETIPNTNSISFDQSVAMLEKKLLVGKFVFFSRFSGHPWQLGKIRRILIKNKSVIMRIVKEEDDISKYFDRTKRQVARIQDHKNGLRTSKRVIAGPDVHKLKPGIIAESYVDYNKNRYLVFFDDGTADYFGNGHVFPIIGQSLANPWQDALKIDDYNQDHSYIKYVTNFFYRYPERTILQSSVGDIIDVWCSDNRQSATILSEDVDTFVMEFEDGKRERIYKGNSRLYSESRLSDVIQPTNVDHLHTNILLAIKKYHQAGQQAIGEFDVKFYESDNDNKYMMKKIPVARKSTTKPSDHLESRTVAMPGQPDMNVPTARFFSIQQQEASNHQCTVDCLRNKDFKTELDVKDIFYEFRDISDLNVPLKLGYDRFLIQQPPNPRTRNAARNSKNVTKIVYETPCKRFISSLGNMIQHLKWINSKMDISFFSFEIDLKLSRAAAQGPVRSCHFIEDIALDEKTKEPIERKMIGVINPIDRETLPQDYTYSSVTRPVADLQKRGFTFNEDFKSGCSCLENCYNRSQCDCQDITHKAFGKKSSNYTSKRLFKLVLTGIFECNDFCRCDYRCPNRVVQNGLPFRLQIVKTCNRGWGVKTSDDIPRGSFICTYSAELLDDADRYGCNDTYYADLDFITANEQEKERTDPNKDEGVGSEDNEDDSSSSSRDERPTKKARMKNDETKKSKRMSPVELSSGTSEDGETGGCNGEPRKCTSSDNNGYTVIENRYPRRNSHVKDKTQKDHEVSKRPRFKKIHDILDSHDFTLDAKMNGNIGRFLNHSCEPNSFAQNVFINTHDLRFPTVAFFAEKTIHAMEEITWNYNYSLGSIPGRKIKCDCGSAWCRGRIL